MLLMHKIFPKVYKIFRLIQIIIKKKLVFSSSGKIIHYLNCVKINESFSFVINQLFNQSSSIV